MPETRDCAVVNYANVLPGMGKTHWALKTMSECIESHQGVLLYVAPTTDLLDEVYRALVAKHGESVRKHLFMLASQGTYLTESSMFTGLPVRDQVVAVLDGLVQQPKVGKKLVYKKCPPGSVVLITHECFLNLPHNPENDEGLRFIKRRPEVKVIFDEARKCLLKELEFKFSRHVVDDLFKSFDLRKLPGSDFYSLRLTQSMTKAQFDSVFAGCKDSEKKAAASLWSVIESLMVTPSHSVYFKTDAGVDATATRNFHAHLLMIPQRLFHGWKNVVLLSAFFEYSQMYHLLARNVLPSSCPPNIQRLLETVDVNFDSQPWLKLRDVSQHVVSAARDGAVLARYRATTITYLSEHTSFSKHQLMNGVLVDGSLYANQEDGRLASILEKFKALAKGRRAITLRKLYSDYTVNAGNREIRKFIASVPVFKNDTYRPLQFFARASVILSNAWYTKHLSMEPKPVPMLTNVGGKKLEPDFWKTQVLSHCKPEEVIRMPFGVHGLNKFKGYHTVAYLASINPTPLTRSLFSYLCPAYNPTLDHTVDHAVQAALRISMRDTRCEVPPLIIVTDKILAVAIQAHLNGLPKVVPPQEIWPSMPALAVLALSTADSKYKEVRQRRHAERMRDADYAKRHRAQATTRVKASQAKNKERDDYVKANSEHHSRVNALRAYISRAKRQNQDASTQQSELKALLPKYKAEVAELRRTFVPRCK